MLARREGKCDRCSARGARSRGARRGWGSPRGWCVMLRFRGRGLEMAAMRCGRSGARWLGGARFGAFAVALVAVTTGAAAREPFRTLTTEQHSPTQSFVRPSPAARTTLGSPASASGRRAIASSTARYGDGLGGVASQSKPSARWGRRVQGMLKRTRSLPHQGDASAVLRAELAENQVIRLLAAAPVGFRASRRLGALVGHVADSRLGKMARELAAGKDDSPGESLAASHFEVDGQPVSSAPLALSDLEIVVRAVRAIPQARRWSPGRSLSLSRYRERLASAQSVLNGIAEDLLEDGSAGKRELQPEIGRIAVLARAAGLDPTLLLPAEEPADSSPTMQEPRAPLGDATTWFSDPHTWDHRVFRLD